MSVERLPKANIEDNNKEEYNNEESNIEENNNEEEIIINNEVIGDDSDGYEGNDENDESINLDSEELNPGEDEFMGDSGEADDNLIYDSGYDNMGVMPEGEYYGDMGMEWSETGVKDPFLSGWIPIASISAATLILAVVLGILLAKKKIKKGIGLYED